MNTFSPMGFASHHTDPISLGLSISNALILTTKLACEGEQRIKMLAIKDLSENADLLKRINQCRAQVMELLSAVMAFSANRLPNEPIALYHVLHNQVLQLHNEFNICLEKVAAPLFNKTLEYQIEKISDDVNLVMEKLNLFRQKRLIQRKNDTIQALELLKEKIKPISKFSKACHAYPFERKTLIARRQVTAKIECVGYQVSPKKDSDPLAELLRNIHYDLDSDNIQEEVARKKLISWIDDQFQKLPIDIQQKIDNWLQQHSETFQKEGRYAKLDVLKSALNFLYFEQVEKGLIEKGLQTEEQRREFFVSLHAMAYGPPVVDPLGWVKNELAFLGDLFPKAIKAALEKKPDTWQASNEEELETDSYSSNDINALDGFKSQVLVSNMSPSENKQKYLNEHLKMTFNVELREKLFVAVSELAGVKEDAITWAKTHLYEDIDRLLNAIDVVKQNTLNSRQRTLSE